MTSSAHNRGWLRGLYFILVITSFTPSLVTPSIALAQLSTPSDGQSLAQSDGQPIPQPDPASFSPEVVPLSPPDSQAVPTETFNSMPASTPEGTVPPQGFAPQAHPFGTPTPDQIPPSGMPSQDMSQGIPNPQFLAPGPGTSTMPAPVSPGDFNVPAPNGHHPARQAAPTSVVIDVQPTVKNDEEKKRTLAIFRTSVGNFTVKLFTRLAPRTTANFIGLARGEKEFSDAKTGQKVRRPYYNGLIFHRVIKGFIIQGGCPFGTGKGGPGYTIADEFTPSLRHRRAGIVAMANAGTPDTNGSQFFITLSPQPAFDDKYTVFGEVIKGMNVIRDIARTKVGPTDRPVKRIYIIAVDIVQE